MNSDAKSHTQSLLWLTLLQWRKLTRSQFQESTEPGMKCTSVEDLRIWLHFPFKRGPDIPHSLWRCLDLPSSFLLIQTLRGLHQNVLISVQPKYYPQMSKRGLPFGRGNKRLCNIQLSNPGMLLLENTVRKYSETQTVFYAMLFTT